MNKFVSILIFIVLGATALYAVNSTSASSGDYHSVEMSVSRLSCGSCVETIRDAITAVNGTDLVETDVGAGRSVVTFDPEIINSDAIAAIITEAGYPATVVFVRDPDGQIISGIDIEQYVARVGSRLIPRDRYNQAFTARLHEAETSGRPVPVRMASQEAWFSVLRQELLLNGADQFGVAVSDDDLDKRISIRVKPDEVAREELRSQMRIESFLVLQNLGKTPNGVEIAKLLNALNENTPVDIFDENLKRYLSSGNKGSGCGGSCCG